MSAQIPNDIPIRFKDPAHEALMNILWTSTLMKRKARAFFRHLPLSEAEFNLLMILRHAEEPLSQNDLSERLLVDKSNVTVLIDRLEKSGAIVRNPVPEDRRRYHITLTESGRGTIDGIDPHYHHLVARIMEGLDEQEYRLLVDLTRKVRQGLHQVEAEFPPEGGF